MISRPERLDGVTFKFSFDHIDNAVYVTLNFLEGQPLELFINSKASEVLKWSSILTRLASGAFREGNSEWVLKELEDMFDPEPFYYKKVKYNSIAQVIGKTLKDYIITKGMNDGDTKKL